MYLLVVKLDTHVLAQSGKPEHASAGAKWGSLTQEHWCKAVKLDACNAEQVWTMTWQV